MLRGLNGQDLFHKDEDYLFFQKRLLQLSHPKDAGGEPMEPFCQNNDGLKLEENHHPSDDDVRQMISERLKGGLKLECMTDLTKNERNEILLSVLQKGAGIRQLGRITGIGFKIIQKLAAKKESKSPSP